MIRRFLKFLIPILALLVLSCHQSSKEPLDPNREIAQILRADFITDISYLMNQQNLDSVFVILTKGPITSTQVGDTLAYYYKTSNGKIFSYYSGFIYPIQQHKHYNAEGLPIENHKSTDYSETIKYKWGKEGQRIYREKTSFDRVDDSTFYEIVDNRIVLKTNSKGLKRGFKIYEYKDRKLVYTVHHHPYNSGDALVYTEYFWNEDRLVKTIQEQPRDSLISVIFYDEDSFPLYQLDIEKQDTMFKIDYIKK